MMSLFRFLIACVVAYVCVWMGMHFLPFAMVVSFNASVWMIAGAVLALVLWQKMDR